MERSTMLSMGKSTNFLWPSSIAFCKRLPEGSAPVAPGTGNGTLVPGEPQWPCQEAMYWGYIRPIFQAYVREYPQKMWPKIWY